MARPVDRDESEARFLFLESKHIKCTRWYVSWVKHLATKARRRFYKEEIRGRKT